MPSTWSHARRPNAPHGGTPGLIPRLENLEQRLQPARSWFGISNFSLVAPPVALGPSQSQPALVAPITVDRDFHVDDLDVRIDLEFPDLGGLEIRLESPDGKTSIPLTPSGLILTSQRDSLDVVLDDEAQFSAPLNFANGIDAGRRYQPPQFQQKQSLSLFDGMQARGDWKVSFKFSASSLDQPGLVRLLTLGFTEQGIDDHGDSPTNASPMLATVADGSTPVQSESGRFDSAADHDFFSFLAPTTGTAFFYIRTTEDPEIFTSPFPPIIRDHATGKAIDAIPSPGNPLLEQKIGFIAIAGTRYEIEVSGEAPCEYVVVAEFAPLPTGLDPEGSKTNPTPLLELGSRGPWTAVGTIGFENDQDWFSWTAPGSLNISLSATAGQDSKLAPRIELYDSGFNLINGTGPNGPHGAKGAATLYTVVQGGQSYRIRIRAEAFEPQHQTGAYAIVLKDSEDDNPLSKPLKQLTAGPLGRWSGEGNLETYADHDAFTFTPLTSGSLQVIVEADLMSAQSIPLHPAFEMFTGEPDQAARLQLKGLTPQNRVPAAGGQPGKRQVAVFQVVAGQTCQLVVSPNDFALAQNRQGTYRISALMYDDEPNNSPATAQSLTDIYGEYSAQGRIDVQGDADIYAWTAPRTMIVSVGVSSPTGDNLSPMVTLKNGSGQIVRGLVNDSAARTWSMRFIAKKGTQYFMEIKDRDQKEARETGGTGSYSISLLPLQDEQDNRIAPLDDSFNGALAGTIGSDDDEDPFLFRPKRSGFLVMTSARFTENGASPGFRVENDGATMLVEGNRVTVVAGKEYSIVVTAGDGSLGTDAVGDYSVGFKGENLSALPGIAIAIPKPSPNDLVTEIDDSAEQATEPVATVINGEESDVADDKTTTLEYPVFGARMIVTIGATARDPLVDLILSSRFGQTLVATSGVDRILPAGTPVAPAMLSGEMVRIYKPVVSVAVMVADRIEEDSRKALALAGWRLGRWFPMAAPAFTNRDIPESGTIRVDGSPLTGLEPEAPKPPRAVLEWAVPLLGSLFGGQWLAREKASKSRLTQPWSMKRHEFFR